MASSTGGLDVPTWNGDPVEFESFATACRWFEKSLKETEKKSAASKVWARLQGPAKAVVKHLNPDEYESEEGLTKLVEVLRNSPLQQLPVPDLFKRLDQWHMLKRHGNETIPQYLVREEDVFTQVQDALKRARHENTKASQLVSGSVPVTEQRGPPSTPSQSPTGAASRPVGASQRASQEPQQSVVKDFFEDELRGYRVLKGAGLTNSEKQNILVQTNNTTSYMSVRRALRTLFADDDDSWRRKQRVWWNQDVSGDWGGDEWHDGVEDSGTYAWWYEDDGIAQSTDWSTDNDWNSGGDWTSWNMYYDGWDESEWNYEDVENDLPMDESSTDPMELQYKEACVLANEAQRTLAEARDAVKKVRQARGYFAPESASGKGIAGSPSSGRTSWSPTGSGSSKGKTLGRGKGNFFGPCFICGMHGHSYNQCPDRFAKGKGRFGFGKGKGSPKGKKGNSKGKKGPFKSVQFHDLSFVSSPGIYLAETAQNNRVILDTGASENAVGMESLSRLISSSNVKYAVDVNDKPIFRFGNGQQLQAASRVDLQDTSLGMVSFYVLGEEACLTPPLMGGKTLREINAVMAYQNNLLLYQRQGPQSPWFAVKMHSHSSHHVSIDLMEPAIPMKDPGMWFLHGGEGIQGSDSHVSQAEVQEPKESSGIFMLSAVPFSSDSTSRSQRLSTLAQRLQGLRSKVENVKSPTAMRGGRPQDEWLPLSWNSPSKTEKEPACCLDDMRNVWTASVVSDQQGAGRILPPHGASPKSDPSGSDGDPERDGCQPGHGEGCKRKADGAEGNPVAEGPHRNHVHQHESERLPQAHGLSAGLQGRSGKCQQHDHGQGQIEGPRCQPDGADHDGGRELSPCQGPEQLGSRGVPKACDGICNWQDAGGDSNGTQSAGCQQEVKAHGCDHHRIGCGGGTWMEQCDSQEGGQVGSFGALWGSLKMLRQKMKMAGTISHQGSQPPDNGDNSSGAYGFKGRQSMADQHGLPLQLGVGHNFQGGHQAQGQHQGATGFQGGLPKDQTSSIESQLPTPGPGGGKKRGVQPHTAKKLATNVAILSAMVMTPFRSLMSQMSSDVDFAEIACAPTSSLSASMEEMGYNIQRINFKEGYDLDRKSGTQKVGAFMKEKKPRHTWVSLPCTRLSSLVNLTQRDEHEEAAFQKRQGRDLKRAEEIASSLEDPLSCGDDVSWEWPTGAKKGWNSRAIARLQALAHRHHRHLYWCHFHGCAYGLSFKGFPVMKGWTVVTTCRELWLSLQKRCPGHADHIPCRGQVAQASSYYPKDMVKAVTKSIIASWNRQEDRAGTSLGRDLGLHLLDAKDEINTIDNMTGGSIGFEEYTNHQWQQQAREQDPHVFALARKRYPDEMPKGKQLEQIKSQMLRVHKAAGHPSMSNLQKLLRARQAPQWAID